MLGLIGAGCGEPATMMDPTVPELYTARPPSSEIAAAGQPPTRTEIPRRVLFIGNSYTQVGDLPGLVRRLSVSAGRGEITVERNTQGGATFEIHYLRPGVLEQIRDGHFTHVVLQGQSQEPITEPEKFQRYAKLLAEAVIAAGAVPVFYETWARPEGDPLYRDPAYGGDPRGMQAIVRAAYQRAADEGGGVIAPIGDAWERALSEPSPPDLYGPDLGHPASAGVYLNGCLFYGALTGHRSSGIQELYSDVNRNLATRLQRIADKTLFGE